MVKPEDIHKPARKITPSSWKEHSAEDEAECEGKPGVSIDPNLLVLRVCDVAERLSVSKEYVRARIQDGSLHGEPVGAGRHWRCSTAQCDAFADSMAIVDQRLCAGESARRINLMVNDRVWSRIIERVCTEFDVSEQDLRGPTRHKRVVAAREFVVALARLHTTFSYPGIGSRLGGRNHSTVITAHRRFSARRSGLKVPKELADRSVAPPFNPDEIGVPEINGELWPMLDDELRNYREVTANNMRGEVSVDEAGRRTVGSGTM